MATKKKDASGIPATITDKDSIPNKRRQPQEYQKLVDDLRTRHSVLNDNEWDMYRRVLFREPRVDREITETEIVDAFLNIEEQEQLLIDRLECASQQRYVDKYAHPRYEDALVDAYKQCIRQTLKSARHNVDVLLQERFDGTLKQRVKAWSDARESDENSAGGRDILILQFVSDAYMKTFRVYTVNEELILSALQKIAEDRGDNKPRAIAARKKANRLNGYERAERFMKWAWTHRWTLTATTVPVARFQTADRGALILHDAHRQLIPASEHPGEPISFAVGRIGNERRIRAYIILHPYDGTLGRPLIQFDRLILDTLFSIWLEQGCDAIFTPGTIFRTRHPGKELKPGMRDRINNSLKTMQPRLVTLHAEQELRAIEKRDGISLQNTIVALRKKTFLCPIDELTAETLAGDEYQAWQFYNKTDPPYFSYIKATGRFTTVPSEVLNVCDELGHPLDVTERREVITDYVAARVQAKGLKPTILADTIADECNIPGNRRSESMLFAKTVLEHFERCGLIRSLKIDEEKRGRGNGTRIVAFHFERQ